jgi:hypothetical protein
MNERIKELYEQAHDAEKVWLLPESLQEVGREGEVKTFNPEKFAELIVRECADLVDNLVTSDDEGNQILDCDDIKTELLEHFGVSE